MVVRSLMPVSPGSESISDPGPTSEGGFGVVGPSTHVSVVGPSTHVSEAGSDLGATEADRIAKLKAFREALTRQVEADRRGWEVERLEIERQREERDRMAREYVAERRLREDLERKVEHLLSEVIQLRSEMSGRRARDDQPRLPGVADTAGASAKEETARQPIDAPRLAVSATVAGLDSWRNELSKRLGDLSSRAEKQISDVRQLHDLKRIDDLQRVEDLKRLQVLRKQAVLRQYEDDLRQRDAI